MGRTNLLSIIMNKMLPDEQTKLEEMLLLILLLLANTPYSCSFHRRHFLLFTTVFDY